MLSDTTASAKECLAMPDESKLRMCTNTVWMTRQSLGCVAVSRTAMLPVSSYCLSGTHEGARSGRKWWLISLAVREISRINIAV